MYLYETIESIYKSGFVKKEIPDYITNNLSKNIKLRDYQKDSFIYTLLYLESDLKKNKQTHLLYHMATGSGKTVIMAMNILYYYKQGYRNFMFFTTRTNIVSKTKINFTKKGSMKYLFADKIIIDGKNVKINVVDSFDESDDNSINICFNTVQGIQSSLSLLREGRLDISDFEDHNVVLIADEAHHLNGSIKDKTEKEDNETWEDTAYKLLLANKNNVLLEYTATCELQDANIKTKYEDKIVYNFRLKEFREAGYTKEFSNYQSDSDKWGIALQAIILSEFRKLMFDKNKISIKPVVLLKSKTIKESNEFYIDFFEKLKNLSVDTIVKLRKNASSNVYFSNAFDFFDQIKLTNSMLVELIKNDFAESASVNMNEINDENENIVNNLDEPTNNYRLIFIVDKLTEGWDVLSLYDIVKLYENKFTPSKKGISHYTISEAQLIGRGARYCPFKFNEDQTPEKRKYNEVTGTPEAICETLLYHCKRDSAYIQELKRALVFNGLAPEDEPIEVEYKLKESFKKTDVYKSLYVFLNEKVVKSRETVRSLPSEIRNIALDYNCESLIAESELLFEDTNQQNAKKRVEEPAISFSEIDFPTLYKAYRKCEATLSFKIIKDKFPNLNSVEEFLTSIEYLGNNKIIFYHYENEPVSKNDQLNACLEILKEASNCISKIKVTYEGTRTFKPVLIQTKFVNFVRKYKRARLDQNNGEGIPQNDPYVSARYRYDVTDKDWYVYNNNFGTTEEKAFIKYFATKIDSLRKKFDKIYVLRNEKVVKVYSFEDGRAFEPDYILLLIKEKEPKNIYYNIFVEPKGDMLLKDDSWKGDALLQFSKESVPVTKFVDDNQYRIWGTPLFNERNTVEEFDRYFIDNIMK